MVPIHSSLLGSFVTVMELSKEPVLLRNTQHRGISERERGTSSHSKSLCKLNYIHTHHIMLHFSPHPSRGDKAMSLLLWRGAGDTKTHVNQCCESQVGGRISWDKYQLSNWKEEQKKTPTPQLNLSRSRWWLCSWTLSSSLCSKKYDFFCHWGAACFQMLTFSTLFYLTSF